MKLIEISQRFSEMKKWRMRKWNLWMQQSMPLPVLYRGCMVEIAERVVLPANLILFCTKLAGGTGKSDHGSSPSCLLPWPVRGRASRSPSTAWPSMNPRTRKWSACPHGSGDGASNSECGLQGRSHAPHRLPTRGATRIPPPRPSDLSVPAPPNSEAMTAGRNSKLKSNPRL